MADDLLVPSEHGASGRVVVTAKELRRLDQLAVRERRRDVVRHVSLDVCEDLPAHLVDPQEARRPGESHTFQVPEQGVHEWRMGTGRAADRFADPNDPRCDPSTEERLLGQLRVAFAG